MSNAPSGYTIRLVYYGRADFRVKHETQYDKTREDGKWVVAKEAYWEDVSPQIQTQNIRLVAYPSADPEGWDMVGVYELVKNAEAPKSDLEGTKI